MPNLPQSPRITEIFGTSEVYARLAAPTGGDLVAFKQSGVGSVLRTMQDKARDFLHVADFGAVGDGVTDDTTAIQAAATALRTRGGGTLYFGNGKTYKVFAASGGGVLLNLAGTNGVTIEGNGATIVSAQVNPASAYVVISCGVSAADNLVVQGLNFTGGNTTLSSATGEYFFSGSHSKNWTFSNCIVKNCLFGITNQDTTAQHYGLNLLNCHFNKVFYPLSLYNTDDVFAQYVTRNCGRSYFPVAPCSNHKIMLDSRSGYTSTDCLMKVYVEQPPGGETAAAARLRAERNTISNIELWYRSSGRTIGAGGTSNGIVNMDIQQVAGASPSSGHFRNIHIHYDVDGAGLSGNGADPFASLLEINKITSAGAADGTARGHSIRNLRVSGVAKNWNFAGGGGLFLCYINNGSFAGSQNWTGDVVTGLSSRDFTIEGACPLDAIYANGQGAVAGVPFLALDNVYLGTTKTYVNIASAMISERSVTSTTPETYTPVWSGGAPSIGNGKLAGYWHKDGKWNDVHIELVPGGTTTFGAGAYELTLPNTAAAGSSTIPTDQIGIARAFESGVANHIGHVALVAGTNRILVYWDSPAIAWTAAAPWTFKNGDAMQISVRYRSVD